MIGESMASSKDKTYTTKELADLAGVSSRTLRYYDQIGLLVPARAQNGYRVYTTSDMRRLQRILFLRSCGVTLESIEEALDQADFNTASMLRKHLALLCKQREELDKTIAAAQCAVARLEAFENMDDKERFAQIKKQSIVDFEKTFGKEARERYGNRAIDEANERMLNMSKTAWNAKEELEQRIKDNLIVAMRTEDPTSDVSKLVAGMHAQWIKVHWGENAYSPQAHVALVKGYLSNPRFVDYYDGSCGNGATEFLYKIIKATSDNALIPTFSYRISLPALRQITSFLKFVLITHIR